jgi:biopolymer transport protein ExbD
VGRTAERTNQAIAKLKGYYDLGKRAQKLSNSTGIHAPGVIIQLVKETGENRATINKCRQFADSSDPRLNFELNLDREGNASIDGKEIGLDELRAQLAKLKDETSNSFSVQINVDSECLFKHVVSVMDVCKEVGGIDYRVASSSDSDSSPDEGDAR